MEDLNIVDTPKSPISPTSHIPLISLITLLFLSLSLSAFLGYQNRELQKKITKLSSQLTPTPTTEPKKCLTTTDPCEPMGCDYNPQKCQGDKIVCGGITGIICPVGYTCQYTDNYPDASGTCVKESVRGEGFLEATVIRSPTCPGPITEQDHCEGPAANETFYIIKLTGIELSERKTVTTDKNGLFTISLTPGAYKIQNSENGIGKNISNPNFTISAGNTTIQKFSIDTGIR